MEEVVLAQGSAADAHGFAKDEKLVAAGVDSVGVDVVGGAVGTLGRDAMDDKVGVMLLSNCTLAADEGADLVVIGGVGVDEVDVDRLNVDDQSDVGN